VVDYEESHECIRQKGAHVPIRSLYPFPLVVIVGIGLAECGDMSKMAKSTEDGMESVAYCTAQSSSVSASNCARRKADMEEWFAINRPTNPAITIDRESRDYYTSFQRIVSPLLHLLRAREFKQSIYRRLFCFL